MPDVNSKLLTGILLAYNAGFRGMSGRCIGLNVPTQKGYGVPMPFYFLGPAIPGSKITAVAIDAMRLQQRKQQKVRHSGIRAIL